MKKYLFALFLGCFWLASCKNEPPRTVATEAPMAERPAPVVESPAPVAEAKPATPEPPKEATKPAVSAKKDPAPQPSAGQKPEVEGQNLPKKEAQKPTEKPGTVAPPVDPKRATALHGKQPAPRSMLPEDAMCFVARETDGRVFEVRLAMVDEKKVMGDLLISNVQTGAFVQGRLVGERREKGQFLLSWAFNGEDNVRHITNVSYQLDGNKLIERSRDAEDDGRVFMKLDCSKMK